MEINKSLLQSHLEKQVRLFFEATKADNKGKTVKIKREYLGPLVNTTDKEPRKKQFNAPFSIIYDCGGITFYRLIYLNEIKKYSLEEDPIFIQLETDPGAGIYKDNRPKDLWKH